MALTVDSAQFLIDEIIDIFGSTRDVFAVLGALYVAKKTLGISWQLYKALKTHVIARVAPQDLVRRFGPWAVVTGCTRGIGLAFCEELARLKVNLILLSRNDIKLQEVASYLEQQHQVKAIAVPVDFNEGQPVYDKIREAIAGKEIGILVNNVGVIYDHPKYFLDVPADRLWQLVNVNVAAATMMTHMILPQMVERRRGAIVTLSSGACYKPTPQMTVYAATKVYLDYFSRSLNYEYSHKGITIQSLTPFYVATRMTQYSSTLSNAGTLIPSATVYARSALATLGWSDRTSGYWPHTVQFWIASLIPEWLWMWGATRLNNALRRQAKRRHRHRSGSRPRSAIGSRSELSSLGSSASLSDG